MLRTALAIPIASAALPAAAPRPARPKPGGPSRSRSAMSTRLRRIPIAWRSDPDVLRNR